MGLSSQQVLKFLPLDAWTPVFLIPGNKCNSNGTYLISTNEAYFKRCESIYEMALYSYTFEKVSSYQLMGLVAVEIEGLWCRGKMISYNEFLKENTVVELTDSGSIVEKQLCDLYQLPDSFNYDPLCLAIKPVNGIPQLEFGKFYVQPLLLQSELHKGYVVVNTKQVNTNEVNFEEINVKKPHSLANNKIDTGAINKPECSAQLNSVINISNMVGQGEKGCEIDYVIEFSNELNEVFNNEKQIYMKTLLDNENMYGLNNILTNTISNKPKCLSLECTDIGNPVNKVIELTKHHVSIETNDKSSEVNVASINDSKISKHQMFKNGSSVEFCYGTNIDFVYIRSYEEKQKYANEMKKFYSYYKKRENLKVKLNPKKGDLVAASLSQYKEIHRAVILLDKPIKSGSYLLYLCFFVDVGCKEYVNSNFIFNLLEEAKHVPYLAHKVGLKNDQISNTLQLKYLKNYFDELYLQPLIIEFDEFDLNGLKNAVLINKFSNTNVNIEVQQYLQTKLTNIQSLSYEESESKIRDYWNYNDLFKTGSLVYITHFFNINQIYVRIGSSQLSEYYNQIITRVNQYYDSSKLDGYLKKNPKIGDKVAVKSPTKNTYSRALISKKVDDKTYAVHYIDYGDTDYINMSNIFVLPYKFRYLPRSVVKVGLNEALTPSKIKRLHNYINELIKLSVPLIVEFDEKDPVGFQKVILKKLNGVNIWEEFCHLPECDTNVV